MGALGPAAWPASWAFAGSAAGPSRRVERPWGGGLLHNFCFQHVDSGWAGGPGAGGARGPVLAPLSHSGTCPAPPCPSQPATPRENLLSWREGQDKVAAGSCLALGTPLHNPSTCKTHKEIRRPWETIREMVNHLKISVANVESPSSRKPAPSGGPGERPGTPTY